jgi:hypothetical protein
MCTGCSEMSLVAWLLVLSRSFFAFHICVVPSVRTTVDQWNFGVARQVSILNFEITKKGY